MIRPILIGIVAGARSMIPLALVANAARRDALPKDNGAPALLAAPLVSAGALALAAGELAGDKMKSAPDRIVAAGMAARLVSGAVAGAALAPRRDRVAAGALAATAALGAAWITWRLRMRALRRFGQTRTGAIEDALVLGSAVWILRGARAG